MIKIVPDTNLLLEGMMSTRGPARRLMNFALAKKVMLYGSEESYKEFIEKINMPKIQKYLQRQHFKPEKIILEYRFFITMSDTNGQLTGINVVKDDPDDDEYFRIAKSSGSKIILTRDKHILGVKKYDGIIAVDVVNFLGSFDKLSSSKF
jgi:putative PIN family toxin of toxin-antitoxin system